jgi:tol-pal system protein YbgF
MKIPCKIRILLLLPALLAVFNPVWAESGKMTTEQRLVRLERMMRNQNLADLVYQMQQLKQEIQRLNGELELQKHAMDAMNKRQRDLYLDIDQRLSRMQPETGGSVSMTSPPGSAATVMSPGMATPSVRAPVETVTAPTAQSSATAATAPVSPPDPKREAEAYQKAFNLLKQGRYSESINAFRGFLQDYPGGSYEDNAQYWMGEASYVNRDFDTALEDFSKVLINYPKSSKVPGAMLKMGYIFYEKQAWDKAKEVLQRLQNDYPGSTEARLSEKRLQRIAKEGH